MTRLSEGMRQKLCALERQDPKQSLFAISFDYAIIISAAVLTLYSGWWLYPVFIILIAWRQRALENLVHETSHRHLCHNKRTNDAVGKIFTAFPTAFSLESYRARHGLHHGAFWSDKDPDLKRYRELGFDKLAVGSKGKLLKLYVKIYPRYLAGSIPAFFFNKAESNKDLLSRVIFWTSVILVFAVIGRADLLFLFWFVPMFAILPIMRMLAELSEHTGFECADELSTTRNNLGTFQSVFLHPHNDGYHLTHHLAPNIPFYNLPSAHKILLEDPDYRSGRHTYGLVQLMDELANVNLSKKSSVATVS